MSLPTLLLNAPLTENSVQTGPELLTNGNFASWSGAADPDNTPTDWARSGTGLGFYLHDAGNACQLISDGTTIYVRRIGVIAKALSFVYAVNVTAMVSGYTKLVYIGGNSSGNPILSPLALGVNTKVLRNIYTATDIGIQRGAACDNTFTDVSCKEYYLLDASPNARHLSPANQPTWNTLASGLKVMNFNGSTDLLDTGSDWIGTNAITLRIWMRPETAGEGNVGRIWDNGKFIVRIDNTNNRIAVTSDGGTTWVYSANNAWAANVFNHLVVTRTEAGLVSIYINNVLSGAANQDSGTPAAGTTNVFIGNNSAASATFDGDFSGARVWDGLLSDSEIYGDFANGMGAFTLEQVRYFLGMLPTAKGFFDSFSCGLLMHTYIRNFTKVLIESISVAATVFSPLVSISCAVELDTICAGATVNDSSVVVVVEQELDTFRASATVHPVTQWSVDNSDVFVDIDVIEVDAAVKHLVFPAYGKIRLIGDAIRPLQICSLFSAKKPFIWFEARRDVESYTLTLGLINAGAIVHDVTVSKIEDGGAELELISVEATVHDLVLPNDEKVMLGVINAGAMVQPISISLEEFLDVISAKATVHDVTVGPVNIVELGVISAYGTVNNLTVSAITSVNVSLGVIQAKAAVQSPTVGIISNATVELGVISAKATVNSPTVSTYDYE